jgi:hypothetical protein
MIRPRPAHVRKAALLTAAALAAALAALAAGCGVKIDAPHPTGLFSNNRYNIDTLFVDPAARQVVVAIGRLFVVGADGSLTKRDLNYRELERVAGLSDPTAICFDAATRLVSVWEAGADRVSAYQTADLTPAGSATLTTVRRVTHAAACSTGLSVLAPAAQTYLYLADPDSGVVHRFAWYAGGDMVAQGILCHDEGLSARAVYDPAGLVPDADGMMLVCEAAPTRNWVTRFDPTPDLTDTAGDPEDPQPWRGLAVVFSQAPCEPQPQAAYTLGDAPGCDDGPGWTGGPSAAEGEFDAPTALAVDGLGRIFVADTGNRRLQIFSAAGEFDLAIRDTGQTLDPVSIGVMDKRIVGNDEYYYGAYVFALSGQEGVVYRFISNEYYQSLHPDQPPPPN